MEWLSTALVVASLVAAYVIMFLDLSVLVAVHEFGHWIVANLLGFKTPVYSVGFGKRSWSKVIGHFRGTEFRISPIPLGGYVEIPEMQSNDPEVGKRLGVWRRIVVALAGVAFNFIFAVILLGGYFFIAGEPQKLVKIEGLSADLHIARDAGIKVDDALVSVGGFDIHGSVDAIKAFCTFSEKNIAVVLKRGEETVVTHVVPTDKCRVGMALKLETIASRSVSLPTAVVDASKETVQMIRDLAEGTGMIVGLVEKPRAMPEDALEVRGLIGIIQMGASSVMAGAYSFIMFNVLLSSSLILMNLLPFPVLDGGHVVFFLIEGVTGRPVNTRLKELLFKFFYGVLASIMLYGLYNDLHHLWMQWAAHV